MRARCASACSVTRAASALLTLLLIVASTALASEPKFPLLSGRVVDDAGVLNSSTVGELTRMLADHERTTGEQVVVVTLDSLQGYTIEDYGYQLGRHWGIGQKGANTGALLIVAPKEHKVRIEVGYGLEGTLTDAICSTIIQNYILPSLKRGDFNAGVRAGTTSILSVLGGNSWDTGQSATSAGEGNYAQANPNRSFFNYPGTHFQLVVTILFFLIPVIGVVLLLGASAGSDQKIQWGGNDDWDSAGESSFGGGSSGGGFSGGGGSFGGGGASGSW
jgi:uncharacterized protein